MASIPAWRWSRSGSLTCPAKSGRTLDQWMEFIRVEGPGDAKARRAWLKDEHGIGSNTASWMAERAGGGDTGLAEEDPETYLAAAPRYVEEQYAGAKAGLRPIYDRLLRAGLDVGDDVEACPCKTTVPLYRNHVFAQVKPTTRTRVDLGLALKDAPLAGRLIDTGGLARKDRITRRIAIEHVDEIDDEVVAFLRAAYDLDAK